MIRISALVQRLPEDVPAELHPPANQYPGQLPELDVRQSVLPELEAAPVADGDDPRRPGLRLGVEDLDEAVQAVLFGLAPQPLPLPEAVREDERAVAQEVQDVAEEDAVPVQEESAGDDPELVSTSNSIRDCVCSFSR